MAGVGGVAAGATVIITVIVSDGVSTVSPTSFRTVLPGGCSPPVFLNEETESSGQRALIR